MLTKILGIRPVVYAFLAGSTTSLALNLLVAVRLSGRTAAVASVNIYLSAALELPAALLFIYVSVILEDLRARAMTLASVTNERDFIELLKAHRRRLGMSLFTATALIILSLILLFL